MAKTYREVEAKRGSGSIHYTVLAEYRGKPCNLRRHFEMGTTLREIVALADMLAANDPERFIYIRDWSAIKRSTRSIASSLCIAESMMILVPAVRIRKNKKGAARERRGWIVADHDKLATVENGDCTLGVVRNMDAPLRKRGERRWKSANVVASAFPDTRHKPLPDDPGIEPSAFMSAFPQGPSAFQSAFTSAFESAFPDESECISAAPTALLDKDLSNSGERNAASNPLNPLNPRKLEEENPLNPALARGPNPTYSLSFSESKPTLCGQEKSPADALVLELACIADDSRDGVFDAKEQRAIAALLEKHPASDITDVWREHWAARKSDPIKKRFAITDFLKTADGQLAARIPELVCSENGGTHVAM